MPVERIKLRIEAVKEKAVLNGTIYDAEKENQKEIEIDISSKLTMKIVFVSIVEGNSANTLVENFAGVVGLLHVGKLEKP